MLVLYSPEDIVSQIESIEKIEGVDLNIDDGSIYFTKRYDACYPEAVDHTQPLERRKAIIELRAAEFIQSYAVSVKPEDMFPDDVPSSDKKH